MCLLIAAEINGEIIVKVTYFVDRKRFFFFFKAKYISYNGWNEFGNIRTLHILGAV